MTLRLVVTRRAANELRRAASWWAENRPAALGAVRKDFGAVTKVLRNQPGIGQPVEEASSPDTRRIHLDRIRYWVYYRVRGNELQVLSVWHSGRGSGPSV